jgi:hypothetical protein
MAEAVANPTINTLAQLEAQNIQALKARIEEERQARLAAARGQAISRGLQGSSFETRAMSEVNRLADEAMASGEREIREQFNSQRLQLEENELTRKYQSLEDEKNRAFQAGENDKARAFQEQQALLEREAAEMQSRREGRAALASSAAQIGTMALLTPNVGQTVRGNVSSLFGRTPTSALNQQQVRDSAASPNGGALPPGDAGVTGAAGTPGASAPGLFSRPIIEPRPFLSSYRSWWDKAPWFRCVYGYRGLPRPDGGEGPIWTEL